MGAFQNEGGLSPPAPIRFGCEREHVGSIERARRRAKGLGQVDQSLRPYTRRFFCHRSAVVLLRTGRVL